MTTRCTARIALIDALRELERWDDAALDSAFRYAQHAAYCILDLRGSTDPITMDRSLVPRPTVPPAAPGLFAGGRSTSDVPLAPNDGRE